MKTHIFNGQKQARKKLDAIKLKFNQRSDSTSKIKIKALVFDQDRVSWLYTSKKRQAASYIGIDYQAQGLDINITIKQIKIIIDRWNQDDKVIGIIIQKPSKKIWNKTFSNKDRIVFTQWWHQIYQMVDVNKDVDGLTPKVQKAIADNSYKQKGFVLPATCKAVLEIMSRAQIDLNNSTRKFVIVGRSELLGKPLYWYLNNKNQKVELIGKKEFEKRKQSKKFLLDADVIVSATGKNQLITKEMIKQGAIIIDAGEPHPEFDYNSLLGHVSFITPVPGGVGPMTVSCLMENCWLLIKQHDKF